MQRQELPVSRENEGRLGIRKGSRLTQYAINTKSDFVQSLHPTSTERII